MGLSIKSMGCCHLWCLEPSHGTEMADKCPIHSSIVSGGVPIALNIASSLQSAVKLAGTHACKALFWFFWPPRPPGEPWAVFPTVFRFKKIGKLKKVANSLFPSPGRTLHSRKLATWVLLKQEITNKLQKTTGCQLSQFWRNFELKIEKNCRYSK